MENMSESYNDVNNELNELSESENIRLLMIPMESAGQRLDVVLASLLPEYSRSRLQTWIKNGAVKIDGDTPSTKFKVLGGETVEITEQLTPEEAAFLPEPIPLNIVFEDDALLVIHKPAGLVVHPAAGNWQGTLLNGLLHYSAALKYVPRAGIVHRLDKDTSGLMVVAKTTAAQTDLVRQLQARKVSRIYRAIVDGRVPHDGVINEAIGRDPHQRQRMAVVHFGGKPAITHVKVLQRFDFHSYIECRLETGRTHQIRVHMKQSGHPLVGDPLYGNPRYRLPEALATLVKPFSRQALHALSLAVTHPTTGERLQWKTRLPEDMRRLLADIQAYQHAAHPLTDDDEIYDDFADEDESGWEVIY